MSSVSIIGTGTMAGAIGALALPASGSVRGARRTIGVRCRDL